VNDTQKGEAEDTKRGYLDSKQFRREQDKSVVPWFIIFFGLRLLTDRFQNL